MNMQLLHMAHQQGEWTPADLFGASEAGFWYDLSDLSTLWKADGTDPVTADGDAIYRIDDKSGNGNNAVQATLAKRGAYKTSAGLHWVLTDGTADNYLLPDPIQSSVSDWFFCMGFYYDKGPDGDYALDSATGRLIFAPGYLQFDIAYYDGTWTDHTTSNTAIQDVTSVVSWDVISGSSRMRVNGSDDFTGGAYTQNKMSGATRLFSSRNDGAPYMAGSMHQIVAIDRTLTAEEVTDLESFVAGKSGVTL